MSQWFQSRITLKSRSRGFHLITDELVGQLPDIGSISIGMCHVFLLHTSASLTINENADPTVRDDFESHINQLVPENQSYYRHTYEGPDDMPAHLKSSLLGHQVTIPISNGELALGMWQGIYLGEHRNHAGPRSLMVTIMGQANS